MQNNTLTMLYDDDDDVKDTESRPFIHAPGKSPSPPPRLSRDEMIYGPKCYGRAWHDYTSPPAPPIRSRNRLRLERGTWSAVN